jgi:hypothetical protein
MKMLICDGIAQPVRSLISATTSLVTKVSLQKAVSRYTSILLTMCKKEWMKKRKKTILAQEMQKAQASLL